MTYFDAFEARLRSFIKDHGGVESCARAAGFSESVVRSWMREDRRVVPERTLRLFAVRNAATRGELEDLLDLRLEADVVLQHGRTMIDPSLLRRDAGECTLDVLQLRCSLLMTCNARQGVRDLRYLYEKAVRERQWGVAIRAADGLADWGRALLSNEAAARFGSEIIGIGRKERDRRWIITGLHNQALTVQLARPDPEAFHAVLDELKGYCRGSLSDSGQWRNAFARCMGDMIRACFDRWLCTAIVDERLRGYATILEGLIDDGGWDPLQLRRNTAALLRGRILTDPDDACHQLEKLKAASSGIRPALCLSASGFGDGPRARYLEDAFVCQVMAGRTKRARATLQRLRGLAHSKLPFRVLPLRRLAELVG